MFVALSPINFKLPAILSLPGPVPMLQWIEVGKLIVDDTYQREIGYRGRLNVQHIIERFDWSKFAPVIVAPVEGDLYAIVDGQHRTTAAMVRGIEKVPCQIVLADRTQQAAAYAAVNGNITKTTPHQLFHAKLAAGDEPALELKRVCAAAGVEILRRSRTQANMEVGQTLAVGALARCLQIYGRDTLITSLHCITQTADGNPGFVRATIVEGICAALDGTSWRDTGEALLRAMDGFSFVDAWGEVTDDRDHVFPGTIRSLISDKVRAHLTLHLPVDQLAA